MGFPDCPHCSILRQAQRFVKARLIQNGMLLKTFFESPYDWHEGYEAGRSTAGLPVVLPAGFTNWLISLQRARDPQGLALSASTENSGSDMWYGRRKCR